MSTFRSKVSSACRVYEALYGAKPVLRGRGHVSRVVLCHTGLNSCIKQNLKDELSFYQGMEYFTVIPVQLAELISKATGVPANVFSSRIK